MAAAQKPAEKADIKTLLEVTGAAVVLKTADGSERYLYQGAPVVREAFTDASLAHAISVGLITETEVPAEDGEEQKDAGDKPAS